MTTCTTLSRIGAAGRNPVSNAPKAGAPFATPHFSDSASAEGNAVDNHCGDLGAYQFGIDTDLREGGCGNLAERRVGSRGGESCRMMPLTMDSRAFSLLSWINLFGKARLWLRLPRTDSKPAPARRFLGAGRIGDAGIASVRRPELVGQETARNCEHAAATDDPHTSLLAIFIASRLSGLCSRLHIGCP